VSELAMFCLPNYSWEPWRFERVPRGYWSSQPAHLKMYFDWAAKELGISLLEDWYKVSTKQIDSMRGSGLLHSKELGRSLHKALKKAYPTHNWLVWKFKRAPKGSWNVSSDQFVRNFEFSLETAE